jgi:hypothetical protein
MPIQMNKIVSPKLIAGLALLLAGCGSPGAAYYEKQPWAYKAYDEASTECQTEIQKPGGPPSYHLCMRAKGWAEVHACREGLECLAAK